MCVCARVCSGGSVKSKDSSVFNQNQYMNIISATRVYYWFIEMNLRVTVVRAIFISLKEKRKKKNRLCQRNRIEKLQTI